MKNKIVIFMVLSMIAALLVPVAYSQANCTVKGTVIGEDGKPMVGAQVLYYGPDTGRKYTFKTDKFGRYYAITVTSGKYKVSLLDDKGQPFKNYENYFVMASVTLSGENETDINLQKARADAGSSMTEEQKKQYEKAKAENAKIGKLNDSLKLAAQQETQNQFEDAVKTMEEAAQVDQSHDLIWASLGNAYLLAAKHNSDRTAANDEFTKAADAYKKAIALKPVGAYYNNMGEAYAKLGQTDDAVSAYTQAAQNDPTDAARYYFNLGAILTNVGKPDEANAAFDKAIAADPTRADAYYQKSVNLLSKATVDKDGKVVAPPEVAQGLNKYLELEPNGSYSQSAKELLASLGEKVQTSFGNTSKKSPAKKK
jgi:tetratricopeptide (TPR) repeat protein